jgi:deazaflavin-dependent oxidoreductase (nitroreductase family)
MMVRDRMARFNRRVANRVIGPLAGRRGSPVAFMVHRGRRSGRPYRTPMLPLPLDDGYLISLPYGADRDWVRNVVAAGGGTLVRGGRQIDLTHPRLLGAGDAAALLPGRLRPALRLAPGLRFMRLSLGSLPASPPTPP